MTKQIAAFTEFVQPPPGEYVKFLQAFLNDDCSVEVRMRDRSGITYDITLPYLEVVRLFRGALSDMAGG